MVLIRSLVIHYTWTSLHLTSFRNKVLVIKGVQNMTDRELLELAAKAAKYDFEWINDGTSIFPSVNGDEWNPLTDDGDALRLAGKCMISIIHSEGGVDVVLPNGKRIEAWGYGRDDATRRAIVRAAAEIGKGMK